LGLIMGKIIRLAGVNLTDLTAPKILERDPIESDGSLMLFDGSHEFGAFSGLPINAATIPNVLANKAAGVVGGSAASLNLNVARTADLAGVFLAERTARGGIHGIITQGGGQTDSRGYMVSAPAAVREHVRLNPTRGFYASIWTRITRRGLANGAPQSSFHLATTTGNYHFFFQGGEPSGPFSPPASLGRFSDVVGNDHGAAPAVPYNRFAALGFAQSSGTGTGTGRELEAVVGTAGAWGSLNYNKAPSRIIYRAYVEDLTASGRTFAAVQALDFALYQAAFAPGGKFHGDTYTDPATLP